MCFCEKDEHEISYRDSVCEHAKNGDLSRGIQKLVNDTEVLYGYRSSVCPKKLSDILLIGVERKVLFLGGHRRNHTRFRTR